MAPHNHHVLQGEVCECNGELMLYAAYGRCNNYPMRAALAEFVRQYTPLQALVMLRNALNPRSYGWLWYLLCAYPKILEISAERQPHLIVLGAKGLRSTANILLGGVAQQVMEYACCPVLIVRAPYRGLSKILAVTDGSPSSLSAACYLAEFPLPAAAEIHVMHVLPPLRTPLMVEPYLGAWQTVYIEVPENDREITEIRKKELKKGEQLLERTCSLLRRYGIDATTMLARGDAATEIMDYVKKHRVDLIVAGSRGFGNFTSLWKFLLVVIHSLNAASQTATIGRKAEKYGRCITNNPQSHGHPNQERQVSERITDLDS